MTGQGKTIVREVECAANPTNVPIREVSPRAREDCRRKKAEITNISREKNSDDAGGVNERQS